jgi:hypothetical protein
MEPGASDEPNSKRRHHPRIAQDEHHRPTSTSIATRHAANNETNLNIAASDAATVPRSVMSSVFFVFRVSKALWEYLETIIVGQSTNVSDAFAIAPGLFTQ